MFVILGQNTDTAILMEEDQVTATEEDRVIVTEEARAIAIIHTLLLQQPLATTRQ